MPILSKQDTFNVINGSLIADYDYDIILDLYMPIIGYKACLIYFKLVSLAKHNVYKNMIHDDLFNMMQISCGDFAIERQKLEAIGLLTTSIKINELNNDYQYRLFAPKTPYQFFDNVLFSGLLNEHLDRRKVQEIKNLYNVEAQVDLEQYKDITTHFGEIFKPNYNVSNLTKLLGENTLLAHKNNELDLSFDYDIFLKFIEQNSQISKNVFSKNILEEIKRLATLYGIDEESSASYVIDCFEPFNESGNKINFEKLSNLFQESVKYPVFLQNKNNNSTSQISNASALGQKINLMETMSCKDFLQLRQGNIIPVSADLDLIDDLNKKIGLKPCVINALLDYTLEVNNNILSKRYVEKIAASIKRENITTAYDTMSYLNGAFKHKKKTIKNNNDNKPLKIDEPENQKNEGSNSNKEDDISWDELLNKLK